MKKKRISSQQIGLSILILILLLGWGLNFLFSLQGNLGPIRRKNEIFTLITGEVKNPGVYVFGREPSLKGLIAKAGGLKAKLIGRKWDRYLYLTQGTSVQISSENGYMKVSTDSIPAAYKVTLNIPISINTAAQEELETIPDIGPSLAKKIINYRSLYGPFDTVEEIKSVSGIGKRRYLKIKPYIGT
jgi:competence protein ComEA